MKILWITNIELPEATQLLTGSGDIKATGGWLLGAAEALVNSEREVELFIATVSRKVKQLTFLEGKKIKYFLLPYGKGNRRPNSEYERYWRLIKQKVEPNVVHIHGTEFSHGYAYMLACGSENVVISIQGMTSAYANYYYYGMTRNDIFGNLTIRDIIKGSILSGQRDFIKRSEYEILMLKHTKHIIGRTSWDRARTWAINPKAHYYFCNEILRADFYNGDLWCYDKCVKHSIFLTQAGYPIKGFHQMLKAMPIILRFYPDAQIRVAGKDITKSTTFFEKLCMTGYGLYIKRLIKKMHLEKKVFFTGSLNGEQMKNEYIKANVFVCPSTIENSPNSLGEAQILGTPCVASYVGGIPDMMKGQENGLYRFEEVEMLAQRVCEVFSNPTPNPLIENARQRHSIKKNICRLFEIYDVIS